MTPGTRLGPYEILSTLGAGGMGEVYRARDHRLDRDVALKILPAEVGTDPVRRQRFEIEARAVAALNHPNIVAIYDVGDGYMVSELVNGESLRGASFGLRKTLDIAAQIAGGLAAAHEAGIVHRDLKPENVLLTKDGRAKIVDFGLARMPQPQSGRPDATRTQLTEPGVVMGTVGYMSPEQVRGADTDHRSDIFSFGMMLHEMLSGTRPFQGETTVDTMQAILRNDAPDLPRTVPGGVREVVSHCLEKDPAHRFQSARDLGFALRALSQGDSQSDNAVAPVSLTPPAPRRQVWLWIGALLFAVAATFAFTRWLTPPPAAMRWSAVQLAGSEIALNPRLSPDGRLLAFQAMVDGTTEVAVMNPDSGNWNVLTRRRDTGFVEYVCWSADGGTIYFSRTTDVLMGIFSVPFLGGEERLVLETAGNPAVLPDGSMLVSRINQDRRQQLFHFWPDTGKLQALPVDVSFNPIIRPGIRISPDGRRAIVLGTMYEKNAEKRSLIEVDLAAGSAQPIAVSGNPEVRAFALSRDGRSIIAALPAKALMRIVRIPLDEDRRGAPEELFTVTSDVWHLDAGADGSVLVNLIDRPGELVRFASTGGQPEKVAHFPQSTASQIVVSLPDGRDVIGVNVSGRMHLMSVEGRKDPVQLVKTQEESAAPMTALAGNRIAFAIGPEPRETIAIADTATGRIAGRISPGKGILQSLTASADGGTLYFTAGGSVWSVVSAGGEPRRISSGDWVVAHPSGSLVVARNDAQQIHLFEVPAAGGTERAIPQGPASRLYSISTIRDDSVMLVSLMAPGSWFNPLALLDLKSGKTTTVAGDRASDLVSAAWTRDGKIVAIRQGLQGTIWKFTPQSP